MKIESHKEAIKALFKVERFLLSHWDEDYVFSLSRQGIKDIEDYANSIVLTCQRMERLVKE